MPTTSRPCEATFSDPGPHPGCIEFFPAVESPCGDQAVAVARLTNPYPEPGEPIEYDVHLCADHRDEAEHDPTLLKITPLPVVDIAATPGVAEVETSQVASVEGVGCCYVVLWTPNAPNYLVRCDPSGPAGQVERCILFETTSLLDALVRVGVIVTAEVAAEVGS